MSEGLSEWITEWVTDWWTNTFIEELSPENIDLSVFIFECISWYYEVAWLENINKSIELNIFIKAVFNVGISSGFSMAHYVRKSSPPYVDK